MTPETCIPVLGEAEPADFQSTSKNTIRLLLVGNTLENGGAERAQLNLIRHLDRERFNIQLFYLHNQGVLHSKIPLNVHTEFGLTGRNNLKINGFRVFFKLLALTQRCDVVFALQDGTPTYLSILAGSILRRPVIGWMQTAWSHNLKVIDSWHKYCSKLLYPLADQFIAVSNGAAEDLRRLSPRLAHKVACIPNPVSLAEMHELANGPLPEWTGAVFAKRTVMSLGRIIPSKGFDRLLKAFHRLIQQGWDLHLLILGEGPERKFLQNLAYDLRIQDRVFTPGYVENIYPFFKRASVFVLSSFYEGLPTVLIEALALGLPAVSTNCPAGPEEILDHGQAGLLVEPGNEQALAEGIAAILADAGLADRLRASGTKCAQRYESSAVTHQFEDLLTSVTRSKRAAIDP